MRPLARTIALFVLTLALFSLAFVYPSSLPGMFGVLAGAISFGATCVSSVN